MVLVSWQFSKDDEESKRFLNDPAVIALQENAKPLSTVNFDDYSAVFYVGGHGPVIDLAKDEVNIELANKVRTNRYRRLPCHCNIFLVLPRREGYRWRLPWPSVSAKVSLLLLP